MRYTAEHKEQTRRKVLTEAAAAIRAVGPEGVGVAALMAKAGLTHGGFYAHFKSKDELVTQAMALMFEQSEERFLRRTSHPDPGHALANFIDMYVSIAHRNFPERGCPVPALSGDLPRMPADARERFATGVERLTSLVAGLLVKLDKREPATLAASVIAEMVGAVALARATADDVAALRILEASRTSLKTRLDLPQTPPR